MLPDYRGRKRFASGGILLHSLQGRRNRMRIQTHAIPTWVALACAMAGLAACDEPQAEQVVAPPQVSVITLHPSPRPYIRELPGRIAPTRVRGGACARGGHRVRASGAAARRW